MAKLDIGDYRAAVAIFEHRHFGRAAAELGVTQPSLTSRLKRMEGRLGARLFERNRRGVEPTAVGLAFLDAARDVIRTAEGAERIAEDAADGLGQILRIGFTQLAAQTIVVDTLSAFRARYPKVRLRLVEASSANLELSLESHALDVAFLHPPLQTSGLRQHVLRQSAGRRLRLSCDGATDSIVGYPQSDAPVMMTDVAEELPQGVDGVRMENLATTVLGAVVLARAGYGQALVPTDYHHPLIDAAADRKEYPLKTVLQTAIATRGTDRRAVVQDLFRCAVTASTGR